MNNQPQTDIISFIGPLGLPELIMILILLVVPVVIIVSVIHFSKSRGKTSSLPQPPTTLESSLAQLESLKSQNLITEAEYEEKRRKILGNT